MGEWRGGEEAKHGIKEKFEALSWQWFQDHCFWIEVIEVVSNRVIIIVFFISFAWIVSVVSKCTLWLETCPPTVHPPKWSFWSESDCVTPLLKTHYLWNRSVLADQPCCLSPIPSHWTLWSKLTELFSYSNCVCVYLYATIHPSIHPYFEAESHSLLSHGLLILKGKLYPSSTKYSVDGWSEMWNLSYLGCFPVNLVILVIYFCVTNKLP